MNNISFIDFVNSNIEKYMKEQNNKMLIAAMTVTSILAGCGEKEESTQGKEPTQEENTEASDDGKSEGTFTVGFDQDFPPMGFVGDDGEMCIRDSLCRFRTSAEQKKTVEDLKKGLVDVVIGTHRVLSKDVGYKDLGLLIIDEEQRFGVVHKEKIKKLRENVDVLTLTATPIPRTLHMSLIGIRDMSVLEEAPQDRMPIQTYVMEYNDEMVREAIERELSRGGQVYYVYNRVNDIADVALQVQNLVPEASVTYAHGQMNERQLEMCIRDRV